MKVKGCHKVKLLKLQYEDCIQYILNTDICDKNITEFLTTYYV